MPTPFSTGPGYEAFNLVQTRAVSSVLSPDEKTLYVSTTDGKILVFDLATLTLVRTINVAGQLGAMNISDDGATAYVVGAATAGGNRGIYEVNLATGARSLLPNTSNLSPFDVEFVDGNRLLISGSQSWIYNLTTQAATSAAGGNLPGFGSITSMVESDGLVLIAELEASNGALELYDETQGRVISAGSTFAGGSPSGFNNGVMAVSREAGLIAVYVTQEGLKVFDLNFNLVYAESFWGFFEDGFAFSDDGSFLLALSGDRLTVFDTNTWIPRQIFDMSGSGLPDGGFFSGSNGDSIVVTSDDQTIIVTNLASGWVHVLSLAEPLGSDPGVTGTEGDDALVAIIGQDVDGLGGADTLEIDFRTAQGGVIADFRDLATQSSIVVEGATIANIENIQRIDGSQFDDFLAIWQDFPINNAQVYGYGGDDQIIVGVEVGSFGPHIDGGDGDDLIDARGTFQSGFYFGGAGNDTIYTSNGNSAVGVGGEGNDYIESWGNAEGGDGDDTIVMHNPGNVSGATPRGSGGAGNDILSAINLGSPASLPTYFLQGGAGADRITGSEGQDYLTSTEFDSSNTSTEDTGTDRDTLIGGAGNDRLFAGFGDDVDGGADFDVLVYSFGGSPTGISLNTDSLVGAGPFSVGGGTIQSIEAIDWLYGSNFDDVITVGANSSLPLARTQVFGGLGNDTFMNTSVAAMFIGGDGNDTYVLLAGSQTSDFSAGDGSDTVDYSQLGSGVAVMLSSGVYGEFGSGAGGSLFSVENVIGTNQADTIIGSSADNRLIGGNGSDIIDGGYGDDFLDGGSGTDELRFFHGFNGVNVNLGLTAAQNTGLGLDTIRNFENLGGSNFSDTLIGSSGNNVINGYDGDDVIDGAAGDDTLIGGAGIDTAVYNGDFSAFSVSEGSVGAFTVSGAGTDTLDGIERLRFNDIEILLDLGSGLAIDPGSDNPDTFMINIRDFDGNDLGGALSWEMIGEADANLDGSADFIFVNREIGRFAEVSVGADGLVQFDNHGQGGDTRVVGIYIDPLVESGEVEQGSDFDSQRRFQNDLFIGNIATVLGSEDYDGDGFAEVFFALTDGTAYLRAIMHADGNIQYANYQSEQQVIDYLTANGYDETTFGDWFPSGATGTDEAVTFINRPQKAAAAEASDVFEAMEAGPLEEWHSEFFG